MQTTNLLEQMAQTVIPEKQSHFAQQLAFLPLKKEEMEKVKLILNKYLQSKNTAVQINSLQAISDLARQGKIDKSGAIWSIYFLMSHVSTPKVILRAKKILKTLEN